MKIQRCFIIRTAALVFTCLASPSALATAVEYKVTFVRPFEIQAELDKHSRNGWKVRAMSTSNQCSYTQANGAQVKGECQVIILERERK